MARPPASKAVPRPAVKPPKAAKAAARANATAKAPDGPSAGTPDISIVVPVFNEEGAAPDLAREIAAAFKGRNFEIIFVNDASRDATQTVLTVDRCSSVTAVAAIGDNVLVVAGLEVGLRVVTEGAELLNQIR